MRIVVDSVLIDTSAWIDFFRSISGAAGDVVTDLIRLDKAYLTGPIIAELLHGVRGKKNYSRAKMNLKIGKLSKKTYGALFHENKNSKICQERY